MKKIFGIVAMLFFTALWSVSCSPDDFALGDVSVKPEDLVEGIAFKIEHDASNPNIVYLTSLMGAKYTPLWDHPQGRSQAQKVTLKIPFAGSYQVKFGVETRGGIVYGAPATFTVDALYAGFISDEMWTLLAGGAGNEKTWYLDLDAEGVSRKFLGPMYFFDNWYTWDGLHTASGDNYIDANPWDWTKAILPTLERVDKAASGAQQPGVQAWYWLADWPGNSWTTEKADFGSMTFDLKDAANVVVDQQAYGLGKTKGSFMLDVENHMIKFTDARPIHDKNRDKDAVDWSNVRLLYLTKDAMQLGIVPNGDKSSMTVYNYISKDYRDNWVPGDTPEPEPPYSGDANADLTTSTTTTKKWALSLNNPYDWTNLSGGFLNGWKTAADYAATGWAPYDASLIKNISLSLTKTGATTGDYVFTNGSGTPISGSYTIGDKNNIVFDKAISFTISGGISLATTADHSLRLLSTEVDALGSISGMWLGQRAADKDEYTAYHFIQ